MKAPRNHIYQRTTAWHVGVPALALAVLLAVSPLAAAGCAASAPPTSAAEVIATLRSRGLPIGESVDLTAETDTNNLLGRPNGYLSKTVFLDTRLEREELDRISADDGGSVEVFADADGARRRKEYIDAIGKAAPMFGEYSYLRGPVLVRLSRRLTPEQARTYEAGV